MLTLQAALASGRVRPAAGEISASLHFVEGAPADAPALLGRDHSKCVFYDGRCRIHTALGHGSLPVACRQFPRVSLLDPRGASVTLSHYCPTAAALLDADTPAGPAIALNAPAFPSGGEYVGLDARTAWPPLVRRDLLMDWESWWECERLAVELLLSDVEANPARALACLRTAVDDVQRWSPSDGPLGTRVAEAFDRAAQTVIPPGGANRALIDAAIAAIPSDIRPARFSGDVKTSNRATHRFLAAHAFASWAIHSARGLSAWMASIDAAFALLGAGAGVRQADLILRHLADQEQLARQLTSK